MSENVVSLKAGPVASDAKAEFMRHMAASFEKYVEDFGCEPDALVAVYCGLKQTARAHWLIRGESEGGAASIIALAAMAMMREIAAPEPEQ
jgi:hypothetical protein